MEIGTRYEFVAENGVSSACNVYVMKVGSVRYVGFENIGEGVSVTNAAEQLVNGMIQKNDWDPEDCFFFEWYNEYEDGTVDMIEFTWNDRIASNPKWKVFCEKDRNPFKS